MSNVGLTFPSCCSALLPSPPFLPEQECSCTYRDETIQKAAQDLSHGMSPMRHAHEDGELPSIRSVLPGANAFMPSRLPAATLSCSKHSPR